MDSNGKSYLKSEGKWGKVSLTSRTTIFVNYLADKKIKTQNFEEMLEMKH